MCAANPASAFTTFTVERELSTGQLKERRLARRRADHGAVRPSCRESGQPRQMQIFMQCMECVFTVEDKNAG